MDNNEKWDLIIKPAGNLNFNLKELLHYKFLMYLFVKRDFVTYYKQTILGPLWYIIQPLLTTLVFTVIFGNIAKIPTDGIPTTVFYLIGITFWGLFSESMTSTSNIFVTNAQIFGKVYFPRLTVPIARMTSNYIKFFIQLFLFLGFYLYFLFFTKSMKPNLYLLFVPLICIQFSIIAFGIGIIISSLTTKYRDLQFVVTFGVQLWMYATPVIYPMSNIPSQWLWVFIVNPIAYPMEFLKYAFTGQGIVNFTYLGISFATSILLLIIGLFNFNKVEKDFMDRV